MILTCPQCESRYLLPATTLGQEGHRVKCSSCGNIWHQEPDPEELNEALQQSDLDQAFERLQKSEAVKKAEEDIPEAVKPIPEGAAPAPTIPGESGSADGKRAVTGGFLAAAAVFVLMFAGLYSASAPIMAGWPASAAFYKMLGKSMSVPGEGLVFDRLNVKAYGDDAAENIEVSGFILNLTAQDQNIPLIEASLKDDHDQSLEKWLIRTAGQVIEAEGALAFSASYKAHKTKARNIFLRFVLKGEKGLEIVESHALDAAPEKAKEPAAPAEAEQQGEELHPPAPAEEHH